MPPTLEGPVHTLVLQCSDQHSMQALGWSLICKDVLAMLGHALHIMHAKDCHCGAETITINKL